MSVLSRSLDVWYHQVEELPKVVDYYKGVEVAHKAMIDYLAKRQKDLIVEFERILKSQN